MYLQQRQSPSILSRVTSPAPSPIPHRMMQQPRPPLPNYYTNMPMYQYIRNLNGMNMAVQSRSQYVPPGGYPPAAVAYHRNYYQPRPQVVYAQPAPPPPPQPQPQPPPHLTYQQAQYNQEYYNYYYNNYRTSPVYAQSVSPPPPVAEAQFKPLPPQAYYNNDKLPPQHTHYYQNHNDELLTSKPPKNNAGRSKKKSKYLLKDMWEEQEPTESDETKIAGEIETKAEDERIIQGYINNLEQKKSEDEEEQQEEEEEATVVETNSDDQEEEIVVKVDEKKEERPLSRTRVYEEKPQPIVAEDSQRVKDKLEIFEQVILNSIKSKHKKGSAGRVTSRPESRQSDRHRASPGSKLLSLANPWSPEGQLDTKPASIDDDVQSSQFEKSMEANSYEKWVEKQLVNESKPDMVDQVEIDDKQSFESSKKHREKSSFASSIKQKGSQEPAAVSSYGYKLYKLYQDEDGLFSLREI